MPILVGSAIDVRSEITVVASKAVQTLTRNDPRTIPGHTRAPHTRIAAKAIPAGGQIAVAYPGGIANNRASLPVAQYAAAMPLTSTRYG
jgi:hypothetical protein